MRSWLRRPLLRATVTVPESFRLGHPDWPCAIFAPFSWPRERIGQSVLAPDCITRLAALVQPVLGFWPPSPRAPERGVRVVFSPDAALRLGHGGELIGPRDRLRPHYRQNHAGSPVADAGQAVPIDQAAINAAATTAWRIASLAADPALPAAIGARLALALALLDRAPDPAGAGHRARLTLGLALLKKASAALFQCAPRAEDAAPFDEVERAVRAATETSLNELQRLRLAPDDALDRLPTPPLPPTSSAALARQLDDWQLNAELFAAAQIVGIAGCQLRARTPVQKDPFDRRLRETEAYVIRFLRHVDSFQTGLRKQPGGPADAEARIAVATRIASLCGRTLLDELPDMVRRLSDPLSLDGAPFEVQLRIGPDGSIDDFLCRAG